MSTYSRLTKNPKTGVFEKATWHDNYYGPRHYGVEFPDGSIVDPEKVKLETMDWESDTPKEPKKCERCWKETDSVHTCMPAHRRYPERAKECVCEVCKPAAEEPKCMLCRGKGFYEEACPLCKTPDEEPKCGCENDVFCDTCDEGYDRETQEDFCPHKDKAAPRKDTVLAGVEALEKMVPGPRFSVDLLGKKKDGHFARVGFDKLAPQAPEVESWEKDAVGENVHSVYTLCPECLTWGVNMPLEKRCGDCRYANGITYYDAETISKLLAAQARVTEKATEERVRKEMITRVENACLEFSKTSTGEELAAIIMGLFIPETPER